MKTKTIRVAAVMLAASMLGACASVPMASPDADAHAKTFVAPGNGEANLYVYRDQTMGSAVKMPLLLDDVSIGDTGPHTYAFRQIQPGNHTITSKAEKDATLQFTAEAGKNYYVRQEVKMGVWTARTGLELEDESTGENAVKGCKMIQ
jgi:hypothetical protein